jgi:hypothetical protein
VSVGVPSVPAAGDWLSVDVVVVVGGVAEGFGTAGARIVAVPGAGANGPMD